MVQQPEDGGVAFRRSGLEAWCAAILRSTGLRADDAATASTMLVRTDARGGATHGVSRLRSYVEKLAIGEMVADARPSIDAGAILLRVDAARALGQVAGPFAMDAALAATSASPAAICSLRDTGHLGALGMHALRAAEADRVAVIMQATPPLMALPGARGPMMGNNPLAIAAPRPDGPPIVIDMACSVAARGNIILADKAGRPIPEGWAVDAEGRPTTDAAAALKGSLVPFGGHKGMMIAALVELLAGSLSGAIHEASLNTGGQVRSAPGGVNAFILVINPRHMNGWSSYCDHVAAWTGHYSASGGPAARIPGERAHAQEQECDRTGIVLAASTFRDMRHLSETQGVPLPPALDPAATDHRSEGV